MMDYKAYRIEKAIEGRDMIAALRDTYPKYGKPTQSMVDNPEKYGVRLLREAEKLLTEKFGPPPQDAPKPRRTPNRRKPHRLVVYLDDVLYSEFNSLRERGGWASAQDPLEALVKSWAATDGADARALQKENRNLRNELCLRCGRYRDAHLGACGGCRWKE